MTVVGAPIAKTMANAAIPGTGDERRDGHEQHLAGTEWYPRRIDPKPHKVHDQQAEHDDDERWNNASQRNRSPEDDPAGAWQQYRAKG